jgi:nucleoid-associated protein YgaU
LDERRETFPSVPLGEVTHLNQALGYKNSDPKAPYQERWFPGVHGSVGGGGDIRGLSDDALAWVLKGAKEAGLHLDTALGTRIDGFHPDWLAPLNNVKHPAWSPTQVIKADRAGPDHVWQMSVSAVRRWQAPASLLPDGKTYRPKSLERVANELALLKPWKFVAPTDLIKTVVVKSGDTLSAYAEKYYGNAELYPIIFEANKDVIETADDLFAGQTIRIPKKSLTVPSNPDSDS